LFIFLEDFRDPFITTVESASQSSSSTRANLHEVEAAQETASQAHRSTPVPTTHPSIPSPATRAKLKFSLKISFLEINRSTTSSLEEENDAPTLDSGTGLPSLFVDVGVDRHQRTEEVRRNYSSATLSLPHRQRHQENQAAKEPRSSGKT
jgi:hypothetical protein